MSYFSVITINYNNCEGLARTINSVIGQTFRNYQFIVVDGGSDDGSIELARAYGSAIHTLVSERDTGIYNAQNKGAALSHGKYLLFLNSGDFLCDDSVLQKVSEIGPIAEIIYGDMRINWGKGQIGHGRMPELITLQHMYLDTVWHPVSFISKGLFDRFGPYDETLKMVADYDFFFKTIIANKVSTRHIPIEISEYSVDGFSSDKKHKAIEKKERAIVQARYLDQKQIKELSKLRKGSAYSLLQKLMAYLR